MASAIYKYFKERIMQAQIDLSTVAVDAILVDTASYTYSTAHQDLADIATDVRIGGTQLLGSKTFTNGVFDAADITFSSVPATEPTCEALVLFYDSGTDTSSTLIAYIDNASGLPVDPSGGDIIVSWAAGGIFQL